MDILELKNQGLKIRAISRRSGKHRDTIRKYLENPLAVFQGRKRVIRSSILDSYRGNIDAWLAEDEGYTAQWVFDHLKPMGYPGSYQTVKMAVHKIKKERAQVAYLRFETEPGYQAQVDFGEFMVEREGSSPVKVYAFAMILGFSRGLYVEYIERCDLTTFLDCHIRAFRYFGGVPREILYDRMRNVYLGKLAGKTKFNDSLSSLALHYGFNARVAPAYGPWVKGKVERPMDFVREGFWRGYRYLSLERTNADCLTWLGMKAERVHGTTHEKVSVRLEREKPALMPMTEREFDTSYRVFRKVWKDCMVQFCGNRYMVPHKLVGHELMLRVKDKTLRIFENSQLVVKYGIPDGKGHFVKEPDFETALKADQENWARKFRNKPPKKGRAKMTISPSIPSYALPVEVRPMSVYDGIGGEVQS